MAYRFAMWLSPSEPTSGQEPSLDDRPRLSARARLRFERVSGKYVLLSPERGLVLNESASAIVLRCRGVLSVEQIAKQLAGPGELLRVLSDVVELLTALRARRLIELGRRRR